MNTFYTKTISNNQALFLKFILQNWAVSAYVQAESNLLPKKHSGEWAALDLSHYTDWKSQQPLLAVNLKQVFLILTETWEECPIIKTLIADFQKKRLSSRYWHFWEGFLLSSELKKAHWTNRCVIQSKSFQKYNLTIGSPSS